MFLLAALQGDFFSVVRAASEAWRLPKRVYRFASTNLIWHDWTRYSSRQRTRVRSRSLTRKRLNST